jgi:hypothetical protein
MLLRAEFGNSIVPLPGTAGVADLAFGLAAQGIAKDFLRGCAPLFHDQIPPAMSWRWRARRAPSRKRRSVTSGCTSTAAACIACPRARSTPRSYGRVHAVLDGAVDTDADLGAMFGMIRNAAGELSADPVFAGRIVGPVEIAGFERWDGDAMLIRSRVPVAADSQGPVRRAWLARVKAGRDLAGIPNPMQRPRLAHAALSQDAPASRGAASPALGSPHQAECLELTISASR